MNRNQLKRLFPNASKSTIAANNDQPRDPGVPSEPKQVDQERVGEAQRSEAMGAQYRLRHCTVDFYAGHGKQLDEDNRKFMVKPILDALVKLGFASDDKDITTETTQRKNEDNFTI
jgi:hypothetical protein